jgi:hypothetical protein
LYNEFNEGYEAFWSNWENANPYKIGCHRWLEYNRGYSAAEREYEDYTENAYNDMLEEVEKELNG